MSENGIATADDFRKAAEASAFEAPQRVVLPKCGLAVILRRPRPLAFALYGGQLPGSLAARGTGVPPVADAPTAETAVPQKYTREELIEIARFWTQMFQRAFVQPKLSLKPGFEEISPNWIPQEDQIWLIRWMVGEAEAGARDSGLGTGEEASHQPPAPSPRSGLAGFRGQPPGPTPAPGAGGGDLALPSKRATYGDNAGVAD